MYNSITNIQCYSVLTCRKYAWQVNNYDVIKWKHFPIIGPLCGEFLGHRWIPFTKASDSELWCFLWSALNERLNKQSRRWWCVTPSRSLWRHYDILVPPPLSNQDVNAHGRANLPSANAITMTMNQFRPRTLNPFIQVDFVSDISRVITQGLYNYMKPIEKDENCF